MRIAPSLNQKYWRIFLNFGPGIIRLTDKISSASEFDMQNDVLPQYLDEPRACR